MKKLPALKALYNFDAISEFSSFTDAANGLNMTHGAISQQIKALEGWFGSALFERHSCGVRLTEKGSFLKRACQSSFTKLEDECDYLRRQVDNKIVNIGCSSSLLSRWILPIIGPFSRQNPSIDLAYHSKVDLQALVRGEVDILLTNELSARQQKVRTVRGFPDRIGPVCSQAFYGGDWKPSDMGRETLIHARSKAHAWREWAKSFGVTVDDSGGIEFETLSLAIEAGRAGLGFAMTPEFLVEKDIDAGWLVAPCGFIEVPRSTFIYIREDEMKSSVHLLSEWLRMTLDGNGT